MEQVREGPLVSIPLIGGGDQNVIGGVVGGLETPMSPWPRRGEVVGGGVGGVITEMYRPKRGRGTSPHAVGLRKHRSGRDLNTTRTPHPTHPPSTLGGSGFLFTLSD